MLGSVYFCNVIGLFVGFDLGILGLNIIFFIFYMCFNSFFMDVFYYFLFVVYVKLEFIFSLVLIFVFLFLFIGFFVIVFCVLILVMILFNVVLIMILFIIILFNVVCKVLKLKIKFSLYMFLKRWFRVFM